MINPPPLVRGLKERRMVHTQVNIEMGVGSTHSAAQG